VKRAIRWALIVVFFSHSSAEVASAGQAAGDSESPSESAASSDDLWDEDDDDLFDDFDFEFESSPNSFPDPLEGFNRKVFGLNMVIDKWALDPITRAYSFVVPKHVKLAIRSFFDNLNSFPIIVNDTLQIEWKDAAVATTRLAVNSTLGIAGFFDPASQLGLEYHESDFGQTLTLSGVPSGPYLVVPVMGPTNVRDGCGILVDSFLNPPSYALGFFQLIYISGTSGLATREEHYQELKSLEASSVDFYATLRSAYYQARSAYIWDRREHRRPEAEEEAEPSDAKLASHAERQLAGD